MCRTQSIPLTKSSKWGARAARNRELRQCFCPSICYILLTHTTPHDMGGSNQVKRVSSKETHTPQRHRSSARNLRRVKAYSNLGIIPPTSVRKSCPHFSLLPSNNDPCRKHHSHIRIPSSLRLSPFFVTTGHNTSCFPPGYATQKSRSRGNPSPARPMPLPLPFSFSDCSHPSHRPPATPSCP